MTTNAAADVGLIAGGHLSVVKYLINVHGMDINEKWNGRTAIDIASTHNHKAITNYLKIEIVESGTLKILIVILLLFCRFEYIICS